MKIRLILIPLFSSFILTPLEALEIDACATDLRVTLSDSKTVCMSSYQFFNQKKYGGRSLVTIYSSNRAAAIAVAQGGEHCPKIVGYGTPFVTNIQDPNPPSIYAAKEDCESNLGKKNMELGCSCATLVDAKGRSPFSLNVFLDLIGEKVVEKNAVVASSGSDSSNSEAAVDVCKGTGWLGTELLTKSRGVQCLEWILSKTQANRSAAIVASKAFKDISETAATTILEIRLSGKIPTQSDFEAKARDVSRFCNSLDTKNTSSAVSSCVSEGFFGHSYRGNNISMEPAQGKMYGDCNTVGLTKSIKDVCQSVAIDYYRKYLSAAMESEKKSKNAAFDKVGENAKIRINQMIDAGGNKNDIEAYCDEYSKHAILNSGLDALAFKKECVLYGQSNLPTTTVAKPKTSAPVNKRPNKSSEIDILRSMNRVN